ncbi:CoA pyrophosphatase [Pseudoxanthomonas kalamensis DSM 18571]|uniref:CoA pyrophosphatase n=1 Tax=Pseudoxanthomonas kalamensis TaxID=289483 RepID=UPI001390ADF6|nr:CoA pyrophosphatase [Pseudoxanthomonas kalamensis]KAF1710484.1 CoA pyrophosphatase [Pseudoxanthomonas kalamensis DSM 18571]
MQYANGVIASPCTGICTLDEDGYCRGCRRTLAEIASWSQIGDAERERLMQSVLPRRSPLSSLFDALPEQLALRSALHGLDRLPEGEGWNRDELRDLLPDGPLAEAAVLVGLVPRPAGTAVLLTRRYDGLRHHGGQVSFPGGRIDPGDADVVAAALRESREEIALPSTQVQPFGYLDPFATISGFRVTPVVAALDPAYRPQPNPAEVADVFEVPLDFLMSPRNLRKVELEFRGRLRSVLEYDWPGQRIWGATAAILYNLRQRLEGRA